MWIIKSGSLTMRDTHLKVGEIPNPSVTMGFEEILVVCKYRDRFRTYFFLLKKKKSYVHS